MRSNPAFLGFIVVMLYLISYVAIRQNATPGKIFIAPSGSKTVSSHDYRAIVVEPSMARAVHGFYSPLISLDRRITGTVVTVNVD